MLEFNSPVASSSPTAGGGATTAGSASSMLSMINMNIQEAAARGQGAFMLGSPAAAAPLAALHTMTEMKSAMLGYPGSKAAMTPGIGLAHASPAVTTTSAAAAAAASLAAAAAAGTPHGINDILGRSTAAAAAMAAALSGGVGGTTTTMTTAAGGALTSRINALNSVSSAAAAAAAAAGMYFNPAAAAAAAAAGSFQKPLADLAAARQHLYWPGMIHNHSVWRDRFCSNSEYNSLSTMCSLFTIIQCTFQTFFRLKNTFKA